jgi:hypothetical protein
VSALEADFACLEWGIARTEEADRGRWPVPLKTARTWPEKKDSRAVASVLAAGMVR